MPKLATRKQMKIVLEACKGMSSNAIGIKAGVSPQNINNWRKFKTMRAQQGPMLKVAGALRVKRKVLDAAHA